VVDSAGRAGIHKRYGSVYGTSVGTLHNIQRYRDQSGRQQQIGDGDGDA
jgi:hypothetical protein